MSIKIEKALPKDAKFIAESILISSRAEKQVGLFDLIFEEKDDASIIQHLEKLVTTSVKSYVHYSNFLLSYENGSLAGCLCGYEPRVATKELFTQALSEVGIDESYEKRIEAYTFCLPDIERRSWMLDFIHVDEEFHELSNTKDLVQKSLLTARLKGYRKAATLIEIGCAEVELIYKKLGFSMEYEKRHELYLEVFSRLGIMQYSLAL